MRVRTSQHVSETRLFYREKYPLPFTTDRADPRATCEGALGELTAFASIAIFPHTQCIIAGGIERQRQWSCQGEGTAGFATQRLLLFC